MSMDRIRKRDGSFQAFDATKIARAIRAAMHALGREDAARAERLTGRVVELLAAAGRTPTVEQAQDTVERALVEDGDPDLAKAYILYRSRHASLREVKTAMGVHDDLKLSLNAVRVLEKRYLRRDETGRVCETPAEMFRRVAEAVAAVEERYEGREAARASAEGFYRLMSSLDFLPNSPTLMNAGTDLGQLSACFVLPVEDSMDGIFTALRNMAFIHQSGGGTGFNFSKLRPAGDVVKSTGGVASGPISFIEVFDKATDVIRQGGRRRGANMAILNAGHADALDFILCKTRPGFLTNFNISVAVTDRFMQAVREGGMHEFANPRNGRVIERRPAREVFELICSSAWQCGDPGMVFIDTINAANPLREVALIEATNPCGEEPLLPYESCNLGSINLTRFVRDGRFDLARLGPVVDEAVRFLDDVIDANRYPIPEIERATRASRKIGLGVMGLADALYAMDVPYDSEEGLRAAEEVMRFINLRARDASVALGKTRGSFPSFEQSAWKKQGLPALRNATMTTVAPTGTIGLIASVSSGIEPVFALRYWRTMAEGATLFETHPEFARRCEALGLDMEEIFSGCGRQGSVRDCEQLPAALRRVFVTARDVAPEWHVRMQSVFQRHTDNGVSKTINLPRSATIEDVRRAYLLAHDLGCKGITVYREGSKEAEVLRAGAPAAEKLPQIAAESCDPRDGTCRRCPV